MADILHHQSGYCESEDGSDVCRGAVDLGFRRAPFVVGEFRGAFPDREFRTHAGTGSASAGRTLVGKQLLGIDAQELSLREGAVSFEAFADGTSHRAALYLPELRHLHLGRIHFEGRAHGREEFPLASGGLQDEMDLVFQTVDGIDDIVVGVKLERCSVVSAINLLNSIDLRFRVDVQ